MFFSTSFNLPNFWSGKAPEAPEINHAEILHILKDKLASPEFTLDDFKSLKKSIREYIIVHPQNLNELDALLKSIVQWGMERNPLEIFSDLSEILEAKTMHALAKSKFDEFDISLTNVKQFAQELAHDCPKPVLPGIKERIKNGWGKFRPSVLYFLPNVINIFFEALNSLDNHKKFTSPFEKHMLFDIVCKFVLFPYLLIKILEPILVVPAKVYFVATIIILGGGSLVAAYHRWFKPLPNDIVNCKNLDKHLEAGRVHNKVGQKEAIDKLISALMSGCNVLIVGKSGEGKTALFHLLVQLKKEGKLPEKLARLRNFSLNCGALMGNATFGHAEMINQTKDKIEGIENEFLMCFDEVDQLTSNPACFQTFKQCFLNEDEPNPLFIATTTIHGLDKIMKLDEDGSFMQRVVPIVLESASDEQCRLVINDFLNEHAQNIPVTKEAIDEILRASNDEDYLPKVGRLAKIKKLMKIALGKCEWAYDAQYISKELATANEEYQSLQQDRFNEGNHFEKIKKKRELREKISILNADLALQKRQVQKIKDCIESRKLFRFNSNQLTHKIAETDVETISEKERNLFLLYQLYGEEAFECVINREVDKIKDKMNVRIDKALVESCFKEMLDFDWDELNEQL